MASIMEDIRFYAEIKVKNVTFLMYIWIFCISQMT